ncbi:hypothetical protein EKO27_g5902 [Xylaria grammica]|uniref:non-specific serine/threonine protein kinase n=1 Tax=Xylaria grammica TaxID=363999 RepID=A0A439D480_9PEZI|nr:hypothetical protein EKO27_g5902 [Xylaria grammica]
MCETIVSTEPPLATKLPELVRDSRLETTLIEDNTVHIYYDRPGRRAEPRREVWKKERLIGSGGNGVVWLEKRLAARSEEGEGYQAHFRAVKQITSARSRSVLEICKSELEALAKFSTRRYKRCFVRSFGWYEGSGLLSIVMEYCPLGDLQQFLIERTRPPESDTREIISQVVQGLQFMHDEGFAHRDLKPGNILIMSRPPEHDWWVKIGDMGLSKRVEEVGAPTTSLKGTPGFFAPEQLGLGGSDPKMADPFKSDIWCLGEMTFRMLCGEARLYDIEASEPAISFVASAMLAEPRSRVDAHQAFNHEWLVIVHNDSTVGQTDPSHTALDPSYSEPNRDPDTDTEPSGAWSTMPLPSRPPGIESTIRPSSMEGPRKSEIAPWPSLSHHAVGCDDAETPRASRTIRQTTSLQEIQSRMDTKDHDHNSRSSSRAGTQHRTSAHDENPSIDCCNREESCSPKPTTTAAADPPIIHITEVGDAEEDIIGDRSIELETQSMAESMAKLTKIRNYFDYALELRSRYYLDGRFEDRNQRAAEYRWLRDTVMCDILLKADEINTNGDVKLRAQRKALVDRVNTMLDDLENAKKRFDEQEKKQQGVEWRGGSTRHSRPLSQQGLVGDESEKTPEPVREMVQMKEHERERDKERKRAVAWERTRILSANMEAVIRAVARNSRGISRPRRRSDSVHPLRKWRVYRSPATASSSEGGGTSGSSSDDEVRYEPPLPQKTPLKPSLIYYGVYGQVPAPPPRPAAARDGITGKQPGAGLPFSRIRAWRLSVERLSPATSYIR